MPLKSHFVEEGNWGGIEADTGVFVSMTVDPEGSVWGATDSGYAFRLAAAPANGWEGHNYDLAVTRTGTRSPPLRPTAIAAHPSGALFLSHAEAGDYDGAVRGLLRLDRS